MNAPAGDGVVGDGIGQRVLCFDARRGRSQMREGRNGKPAAKPRERIATTIRNWRVETVADAAIAQLSKSRAMPEDLMSDHHQHVILRHVEGQEFSCP